MITNKNGLNDKWARIIGIPVIVVLLVFLSDNREIEASSKILVISIAKFVVYVTIYWECSRFIFLYMRSRFPHLNQTAKRIIAQSLIIFLFILFVGLIIAAINYYYPVSKGEHFLAEYYDILEKSLVLMAIVTIIYECAYFFGRWEHSLYESIILRIPLLAHRAITIR